MLKLFLSGKTQRFLLPVTTFDDSLLLDGPCLHDGPVEDRKRAGLGRRISWLLLFPLAVNNPKQVLRAVNRSSAPLS